MSEKNMNTSTSLKKSAKTDAQLQTELNRANVRAGGGEMKTLYIPEAYRGAFGDPYEFTVNGVLVSIPIGKEIEVPEAHFLHAQRLMKGAVLSKRQRRLTPEEVYKK